MPLFNLSLIALVMSPPVQEFFEVGCDKMNVWEINTLSAYCRTPVMSAVIQKVDVVAFEAGLVTALEHGGHRLRYHHIEPVRDNATASGWKLRRGR